MIQKKNGCFLQLPASGNNIVNVFEEFKINVFFLNFNILQTWIIYRKIVKRKKVTGKICHSLLHTLWTETWEYLQEKRHSLLLLSSFNQFWSYSHIKLKSTTSYIVHIAYTTCFLAKQFWCNSKMAFIVLQSPFTNKNLKEPTKISCNATVLQ